MEARTCVSDLARYIEFLWEEEECLVEHAKSLTAAVAAAHANAEARNQEIYEQSGRFERDRLERQWAFELASVAERAAAAGTLLHFFQLVGRLLLLRLLLSTLDRGGAAGSSTKPLRSSSSI